MLVAKRELGRIATVLAIVFPVALEAISDGRKRERERLSFMRYRRNVKQVRNETASNVEGAAIHPVENAGGPALNMGNGKERMGKWDLTRVEIGQRG